MRTMTRRVLALCFVLVGATGCVDAVASAGDCGTCSVNATCGKDGAGKPLCVCKTGFTGDGLTCVEDNVDPGECGGTCSPDAKCVKRNGAARCLCNHGFWGDGNTCSETSACEDHNGSCHPLAKCTFNGSVSCECQSGLSGDGWECNPPTNSYIRLVGHIEVCVFAVGASCVPNSERYTWEMSVPLTATGDTYHGTATADVFESEGTVTIQDMLAGKFTVAVKTTTFNVTRSKEFHFSTNADELTSPDQIPADMLPLTVLGVPQDWYFAGPAGKDYTLSGEMTAVFQQ